MTGREDDDRDPTADERDAKASRRDRDAARRDLKEIVNDALLEGDPGDDDRRRAAGVREQSKVDRDAAAKDRAAAAQDRAAARALGDDEPADVIDLDQHRHDTSSQAG